MTTQTEALKMARGKIEATQMCHPSAVQHLLGEACDLLNKALARPEDPLSTPLPCDVKVGHVTIRKGVELRVLVARMQVLYDLAQPKEPKQKPMAWIPIEQMYPQAKSIDILMGDGSILCAVLPQFNGDLWWEGSGTGEKFIDPKYANVTHWRIHGEATTPPQRKPWVSLSTTDIGDCIGSSDGTMGSLIHATEAKLRKLNEAPQLKPLTDGQFQAIKDSLSRQEGWDGEGWAGESWDLALKKAIEAAHNIKE